MVSARLHFGALKLADGLAFVVDDGLCHALGRWNQPADTINATSLEEKYVTLVRAVNQTEIWPADFRISETPIFLTRNSHGKSKRPRAT